MILWWLVIVIRMIWSCVRVVFMWIFFCGEVVVFVWCLGCVLMMMSFMVCWCWLMEFMCLVVSVIWCCWGCMWLWKCVIWLWCCMLGLVMDIDWCWKGLGLLLILVLCMGYWNVCICCCWNWLWWLDWWRVRYWLWVGLICCGRWCCVIGGIWFCRLVFCIVFECVWLWCDCLVFVSGFGCVVCCVCVVVFCDEWMFDVVVSE